MDKISRDRANLDDKLKAKRRIVVHIIIFYVDESTLYSVLGSRFINPFSKDQPSAGVNMKPFKMALDRLNCRTMGPRGAPKSTK